MIARPITNFSTARQPLSARVELARAGRRATRWKSNDVIQGVNKARRENSTHFFRSHHPVQISRLEGMIGRIHRVVKRSSNGVCATIHRIPVNAVCARIEISLDNEMQSDLGEDVVASLEIIVLIVTRLLSNRLADRPHGKNVVLSGEIANDLADQIVPSWIDRCGPSQQW